MGLLKSYFIKGFFLLLLVTATSAVSGQLSFSGKVLNKRMDKPVAGAMVKIIESDIEMTADEKGAFKFIGLQPGTYTIQITHRDFANAVEQVNLTRNITDATLYLREDNLTLDDIQVNARLNDRPVTSFTMDRKALDHMQVLSVTDAQALLPGGKTNPDLKLTDGAQRFSVNGMLNENGNALFGVGVEVDGVRLSPNANPDRSTEGTVSSLNRTAPDLRSIASSNVESVEVITGVASVEYGDITNGVVKINSRKGASPYILEAITKPNTKQLAISKGWRLGEKAGVLNVSGEHTRSVSNLASPYTAYERNGVSLNYGNEFNRARQKPILLDLGLTGNIGGMNSRTDPDQFVDTYQKQKDNVLRGNMRLRWYLRRSWITNLEFSGGFNYNDRLYESNENKSFSASTAAIHSMEPGYFAGQTYDENPDAAVILIPPGYWYQKRFEDNKVLSYNLRLKGNWFKKIGAAFNNVLLGGEYASNDNNGRGVYYEDMRYAPTWRPYSYKDEASQKNMALYLEDRITLPLGISRLQLIGGLRSDVTSIRGSEYGSVSGLSPRFNGQYSFWEKQARFVRSFSLRYGWGRSAKLPSFDVLYPTPAYIDLLAFAPGTTATGQTYYAYFTYPRTRLFNPDLRWQYNIQNELAVNLDLAGTRVTVIASRNKTKNTYEGVDVYNSLNYKITDQSALAGSQIPEENRVYAIDQQTGIVTVTDKTGAGSPEVLTYKAYTRLVGSSKYVNGSPAVRDQLAWVIDFKQIRPVRTGIRLDGNYYVYKSNDLLVQQNIPNSTLNMADGTPFKYIGFYTGGASAANGEQSKTLNLNVTSTTHIPRLRLIFSLRLESTLYNLSGRLSTGANGAGRGVIIDSRDAFLPSANQGNIYTANKFLAVYPDYYVNREDMSVRIPFAEKYLWARENDPALFNELSKLVIKSPTDYYFTPNRLSAYFMGNIRITKEIGDRASITFNGTNFLNNLQMVRSSAAGTASTIYDTGYIPNFYYGLSLRLKF